MDRKQPDHKKAANDPYDLNAVKGVRASVNERTRTESARDPYDLGANASKPVKNSNSKKNR